MGTNYKFKHQLVGAFILITIVTMLGGAYNVAVERRIFTQTHKYFTILDRGDGISPRTVVTMKGIEIGSVDTVEMDESARIVVTFSVFPEFRRHLKGFTYLKLAAGSVIGGRQLELVPEAEGPLLVDGVKIPSVDDQAVKDRVESGALVLEESDVTKQVSTILNNVNAITENLKKTSSEMEPGGDISRTIASMARVSENLDQITGSLKQTTPEIQKTVIDTQNTVEDASKVVNRTRQMLGTDEDPRDQESLRQIDTRDLDYR